MRDDLQSAEVFWARVESIDALVENYVEPSQDGDIKTRFTIDSVVFCAKLMNFAKLAVILGAMGFFTDTDLVKNHDVDFTQFCTITMLNGGADRGSCFCKSCVEAAGKQNIDLKKLQKELLANPNAEPAFSQWQQFRFDTMSRYFRLIHTKIHEIRPNSELRFNDCFPHPETWGLDLKAVRPHLDSIRNSDYSEQYGDPKRMHEKDDRLKANAEALGEDFPRISAVAVRPKATPELIHEGVRIALDNRVCGLSLGHYDGAEFPLLRAISEGLEAERISVPKRLAHQTWQGRIT